MKHTKTQRILAWIGILLLVALYLSTLVFALMKHPLAVNLLMISVFCTIFIPILIYVIQQFTKHLTPPSFEEEENDDTDKRN